MFYKLQTWFAFVVTDKVVLIKVLFQNKPLLSKVYKKVKIKYENTSLITRLTKSTISK